MRRRILYVHSSAGLGGAPLSLLYLIEELDLNRYQPEVMFVGPAGDVLDLYRRRGIPCRHRPDITIYPHALNAYLTLRSLRPWQVVTRALQILPSAWRMRDELRDRPVDLIHLNTSVLLACGVGAAWAGVPVVWHVREPLSPGVFGLRRGLIRRCIDRYSRAVIAISRVDAEPLIPGPKIHVVYNAVNFARFDRALDGRRFRGSLGLSPGVPLVSMLGGLIATKGPAVFVEAAALVRRRRPDVVYVIAGLPPRGESPSRIKRTLRRVVEASGWVLNVERQVLSLIREHGLEEVVRFIGMREDVPELLAASTVVVWPSIVPHFARPIIEASAMARPIVASDFRSTREVMEHEVNGLLAEPGNPASFADAILRMIEKPEEAGRMGEAAYVAARGRFDASRNAAAIMSVYDTVLATTPGGATA